MTGLFEGRTDGPTIFMEFWPHALKGLGTDPAALLKMLQSFNYKFYEIRTPGGSKKPLRTAEPAELLAAHPADGSDSQTDLMLLRGGREPPQD